MSVVTRNRNFLLACAMLLAAPALFASDPSARTSVRMVFDTRRTHIILFGGTTAFDRGTNQAFDLNDTWEWTGDRWVERYPADVPPGRSGHAMVWDSNRSRTIIFGGKSGKVQLNDTWTFDGNDWTQINTPDSPPIRYLTAAAFNPLKDRVVLFGGQQISPDPKNVASTITTKLYDTWEFDGTTWRQTSANGPQITNPSMVYDATHDQLLLTGIDANEKTLMYQYDFGGGTWQQLTPQTLPTCVNDASMVYQSHTSSVILYGGVCTADTAANAEAWEWDGSTWTKITTNTTFPRVAGQAMAYDPLRQLSLIYGGLETGATVPRSVTAALKDGDWTKIADVLPPPRSLTAMASDSTNKVTWLLGGLNETGYVDDFWKYSGGTWETQSTDNAPTTCTSPVAAFDTDRARLVVVCADSTTAEWDGSTWTKVDLTNKDKPPFHQFSSLVYDPVQKKTVLFGGFDTANYLDQTWSWNGTAWTRQKRNPPPARSLAAMWFDPAAQKVLLYGGIGRRTVEDRIERFADMWSYDPNNGWTEMKNVTTPGSRYGAQTAVDPHTGNVILFGGLRVNISGVTQTQSYANDTWVWNGQAWSKIATDSTPQGRENGILFYDPSTDQMVLFGGYNGRYLGDAWAFVSNNWAVRAEDTGAPLVRTSPRRRAVRP